MGIDQDAPIKERTKDMIIAICDDCIDHAEYKRKSTWL